MRENRWMTIFFTDGTNLKFDFPKQIDDPSRLGAVIQKFVNEKQIMVEVEGILITIPFVNVKYIQTYPCPKKLPETAIRAARLKD